MGFLLALIGLALLGFGLLQRMKGNRILAAPFHKTGEIAKNPSVADQKGMVSTEGAVLAPTPLLSPCSKTPCLYYEVSIDRTWEKQEQTQNGVETKKGSSHLHDLKEGAVFQLDDGSGAINVSLKDGADIELKKAFEDKVNVGAFVPGELVFGQLRMQMPRLPSGERTTGFKAVEKIVPVGGNLFALGKLDKGTLVKPGWRSMMLSTHGREGLISKTAKRSKVGFISGGVAAVLSIPLFIFGPKADDKSCHALFNDVQQRCDDSISTSTGRDYTWTVTKAGTYTIAVDPPKVKYPIDAAITVKDDSGKQVAYADASAAGERTAITQDFAAGTYAINIRDFANKAVAGGFTYELEVNAAKVAEADPAAAAAAPPSAAEDTKGADDALAKAAAAPTKATKKAPAKHNAHASAKKAAARVE